ncbi:MAG TPA: SprT-like domain-containing protein [bacterium]|jgi:hypothetical protein
MSRSPTVLLLEQLDLFAVPPPPPPPSAEPVVRPRGPRHQPQGDVYDMEKFFTVINRTAFRNGIAPCVLRWSRNRWRVTLGLCDVKRRVITLNCALDDARVPDMVIAQVMHHEMLHLLYGFSEAKNGTRRFHTPEFRRSEKAFPGYADVDTWLGQNWPMRGRPAKKQKTTDSQFLKYLELMCP